MRYLLYWSCRCRSLTRHLFQYRTVFQHDTMVTVTNQPKISADERAALDELLPVPQQTGNLVEDLAAAARCSMQRRIDNSRSGSAVLGALYRELHSWRQVETATGIPYSSARRWAEPPPTAEE